MPVLSIEGTGALLGQLLAGAVLPHFEVEDLAFCGSKTSTTPPPGPSSHPPGSEGNALPGTVRPRSAIRHVPAPPLCPFFTHVCCVAERWADTRGDDRALRPIADTSGAAASANERTST